jgi:hypothetical protein
LADNTKKKAGSKDLMRDREFLELQDFLRHVKFRSITDYRVGRPLDLHSCLMDVMWSNAKEEIQAADCAAASREEMDILR